MTHLSGDDPNNRSCARRCAERLRQPELVPVIVSRDRQAVQAVIHSALLDPILDGPFIVELKALAHTQREEVVAAARAWIGTPYHHAADVKGHGVDCAMLLVRVYCDLGLVEPFDPRPYTRDWFLHRDEEKYLGFLFDRAHEVREPGLGDTVVFRIGRLFRARGNCEPDRPALHHPRLRSAGACVVEDIVASGELAGKFKTAKFASYWG